MNYLISVNHNIINLYEQALRFISERDKAKLNSLENHLRNKLNISVSDLDYLINTISTIKPVNKYVLQEFIAINFILNIQGISKLKFQDYLKRKEPWIMKKYPALFETNNNHNADNNQKDRHNVSGSTTEFILYIEDHHIGLIKVKNDEHLRKELTDIIWDHEREYALENDWFEFELDPDYEYTLTPENLFKDLELSSELEKKWREEKLESVLHEEWFIRYKIKTKIDQEFRDNSKYKDEIAYKIMDIEGTHIEGDYLVFFEEIENLTGYDINPSDHDYLKKLKEVAIDHFLDYYDRDIENNSFNEMLLLFGEDHFIDGNGISSMLEIVEYDFHGLELPYLK